MFRIFMTASVNDLLDIREKLRSILNFINNDRRRIVRQEKPGIFFGAHLHIRRIERYKAPLFFRNGP